MLYDLISTLTTDDYDAHKAYEAYWAVATSDNNALANGRGPFYRYARDYMLRAVMHDYSLTVAQVAWLYEELLPEGPGWGSLDAMVTYGRKHAFGELAKARAMLNCLTCNEANRTDNDEMLMPSRAHAIDCPLRTEGN